MNLCSDSTADSSVLRNLDSINSAFVCYKPRNCASVAIHAAHRISDYLKEQFTQNRLTKYFLPLTPSAVPPFRQFLSDLVKHPVCLPFTPVQWHWTEVFFFYFFESGTNWEPLSAFTHPQGRRCSLKCSFAGNSSLLKLDAPPAEDDAAYQRHRLLERAVPAGFFTSHIWRLSPINVFNYLDPRWSPPRWQLLNNTKHYMLMQKNICAVRSHLVFFFLNLFLKTVLQN